MSEPELGWDLPSPFTVDLVVHDSAIDDYGHTNNAVYSQWCDSIAWAHAEAVGLGREAHVGKRRGMAARRSELHFVTPCFAGERILGGNWIVHCDARLRATRRFQIIRRSDGATLLRALTHYVCIDLESGRPARMPAEYGERYIVEPAVSAALADEGWPFALSCNGRS